MTVLSKENLLDWIPQVSPFRFLDEILDLHPEGIQASYQFQADEYFYKGHFPGNPLTPGVILLEACAQAGLVAFGIYLAAAEVGIERVHETLTVFTEANVEFTGMVKPGERILITAKKIYFRRMKLKVEVDCVSDQGRKLLCGTIAGMAVAKS